MSPSDRKLTYSDAGVDIAAGEKAVELIKAHVRSTFRPEVVGDVGGFGGLFAVDWKRFRDPLLVSSTDGVGTKSLVARLANRRSTIGIDCVAMSVDDIAAQGAEPLFFLDYISIGKLVPEEIDEMVAGVAEGCRRARCALLGGEMSEHPGVMEAGEFDLVGFAVGIVERSEVLPRDVRTGDRIIGFASPGLRCNGYSLARAALLERAGMRLDAPAWPGSHQSLAEVLLEPSVIYAPAMLELARRLPVHAFAHVTGGGHPGQPRAGPARPLRRRGAARHLGGAPRVRRDPAGGRRPRRRDAERLQPRRRHAGASSPATSPSGRSTSCGPRATTPGSSARSSTATATPT